MPLMWPLEPLGTRWRKQLKSFEPRCMSRVGVIEACRALAFNILSGFEDA